MGIDRQSDIAAELQIGPTTLGRVRIYVSGGSIDLPMDFAPEEAREIAAELISAADSAEASVKPKKTTSGKARKRKPSRRQPD